MDSSFDQSPIVQRKKTTLRSDFLLVQLDCAEPIDGSISSVAPTIPTILVDMATPQWSGLTVLVVRDAAAIAARTRKRADYVATLDPR